MDGRGIFCISSSPAIERCSLRVQFKVGLYSVGDRGKVSGVTFRHDLFPVLDFFLPFLIFLIFKLIYYSGEGSFYS